MHVLPKVLDTVVGPENGESRLILSVVSFDSVIGLEPRLLHEFSVMVFHEVSYGCFGLRLVIWILETLLVRIDLSL